MSKCDVSIIIPVYNGEKYIKKCFESIINQNFYNIEIIFVDDCSTDNSYKMLNELKNETKYKVIVLQNNINSGVSFSRNAGIDIANGEFLFFLDCDDTLETDFFNSIFSNSNVNQYDIIMIGFNLIYSNKIKKLSFNEDAIISNNKIKDIICCMLGGKKFNNIESSLFGFSCGKFYKKSLISDIRFDTRIHYREDTLFNILLLKKSRKIMLMKQCEYNYLQNFDSASYNFFADYDKEIQYYMDTINRELGLEYNLYINIFAIYMYMSYLKHYAMHKTINKKQSKLYIKNSFQSKMWNDNFNNIDVKKIPLHYKILYILYKIRCASGIMLLCKLNNKKKEIKNEKKF